MHRTHPYSLNGQMISHPTKRRLLMESFTLCQPLKVALAKAKAEGKKLVMLDCSTSWRLDMKGVAPDYY